MCFSPSGKLRLHARRSDMYVLDDPESMKTGTVVLDPVSGLLACTIAHIICVVKIFSDAAAVTSDADDTWCCCWSRV